MENKSIEQYIKTGGVSCFSCGAHDIEGGFVDIDEHRAKQEVICLHCETEWTDIYKLADVIDIRRTH